MATTKTSRTNKQQLGQFLTPLQKAKEIVDSLSFNKYTKVLEPGCGDGSFILPLIDKFLPFYKGSIQDKLTAVLNENVHGIEIDSKIHLQCLNNIKSKYGFLPEDHNICWLDYLVCNLDINFDHIIGNPPFGGTISLEHQDELDHKYGRRNGNKIKKETYSFFLVKSIDHLKPDGKITFICSDTFLTINTHSGMRKYMMEKGHTQITRLDHFSEETNYPMVIINFTKSGPSNHITLDKTNITRDAMSLTGNFSWTIDSDIKYFDGPRLGDYVVCTGGMTTGKNEYFIRTIQSNDTVVENYQFKFFRDPITLKKELTKARLHKLSAAKTKEVMAKEKAKKTTRNVGITQQEPQIIQLPHSEYCYYNKSDNGSVYRKPKYVIYWKDEGDAVLTFKKNGNWYLHGVGGAPYFKREGITWALISSKLKMRYLPSGYILDSGSPCAFLRKGVPQDELYFIIGWGITDLASSLLKKYINHTKNIQGKDIEKLPYPHWIKDKTEIIHLVKEMIEEGINKNIDIDDKDDRINKINNLFNM